MHEAETWNIAETFQKEHSIANVFMHHPDFIEGVTARLIERKKTRPNWQPNQIEDVTAEEIDQFFEKGAKKLPLLENGGHATYKEYPHQKLALPTEKEILDFRGKQGKMTEEVVQHFVDVKGGKLGVREKVEEVLERH